MLKNADDPPVHRIGVSQPLRSTPGGPIAATEEPRTSSGKPVQSIRWKLAASFIAVACFVMAFVGVAIAIQFDVVERAARLEAEHVAELIADAAIQNNGFTPNLQEYVARLNLLRKRDVVIVDAVKKGLADADLDELGTTFVHDRGNEVGKTISDGKTRFFVETNEHHPNGAHQIVVPLRLRGPDASKKAIGAVILEYTSIRDDLFAAERSNLYLITAAGVTVVLLVTLFGLGIAKRIAQPLFDLKESVERIAAQDYAARVVITSHDEIGVLGSAFNKMAEELMVAHSKLVEDKRELEQRVAERTRELDHANALLQQEVRQHQVATEHAEYLDYYDVLTGLANRRLFLERVAQYMRDATRRGHKLALFLIDLERFKNVNDSLGRPAGDALLRQVAEWLTRNARDANLLARVGADHFAVVLPEVKPGGSIAGLLEKAMAAFVDHPFRLNHAAFRIAFKAGVALFPNDGGNAETLFKHAEAALKLAKERGDRYLFYTRKMTDSVASNLTLENQLRQALDKGEFVLHYQSKINLQSGRITGAEALLRWNVPHTGVLAPFRFLPTLEETGLIHEVGRWVLHKAVEDYLRWRAAGLAAVPIAVNVSPLQLRHRGFLAEIEQAIGIDAHAAGGLELDVTESTIMADVTRSIACLQAIRGMGVRVAIDDFGTGFSSLSHLSKLPVDTLKIDRSFVIEMTTSPAGLALVSTMINLAHSMDLNVVAEGVETEEQSRLLRLLTCDELQGFLFCRPVPAETFETTYLAPLPLE